MARSYNKTIEHPAEHGESGTPVYRIWGLMKQRCDNPSNPAYPRYGGRGIVMCERWRQSFVAFAADMGERPSAQHSVDRIDNDGPYSPDNCRWATRTEQARNRKSTHRFDHDGKSLTLGEWAEQLGVNRSTLAARVYCYHWSIERSLNTPVGGQ
jgi:hypothetical protein